MLLQNVIGLESFFAKYVFSRSSLLIFLLHLKQALINGFFHHLIAIYLGMFVGGMRVFPSAQNLGDQKLKSETSKAAKTHQPWTLIGWNFGALFIALFVAIFVCLLPRN